MTSVVHGGCLCQGVRYKITFPPDHDFTKYSSTCQCEQCRKNSGSLIVTAHKIPTHYMTYTRDTTLRRFYATPGVARSFCGECGGMLSWRRESSGTVSVAVGTIDRDDLKACRGGLSLAVASTHIWCAEEIPGVTDNTRGQRWKYGDGGERM